MPVLESIVAGVLNKYLGKYVENLESKNLDVGILSGESMLETTYVICYHKMSTVC